MSVANIGQMINFRAFFQQGRLDLNEVTNFNVFFEVLRTGPQPSEGSDDRTRCQSQIVQYGKMT